MRPLFKSVLYLLPGLLLAWPAFAQHPDDLSAIRQKLNQERQLALKQANTDPAPKAEKLLELGQWEEARKILGQANPSAAVKLAQSKLAMLNNEFDASEKLVGEALKFNPKYKDALLQKARLQVQAWELQEAKATAQQVLQADPKNEAAALAIGRILMLQKKYDEALAWAQKVQTWNPKNADAYLLESDVYFWNQKPELAEKPLITSLTLNPFNADARFNYGYAIWRRVDATQLNNMAAQWELALELNPLHYVTHWHWGNGHTNLTYADYVRPEDEQVRQELKAADKLISENKIQQALTEIEKVQQKYKNSVLPLMLKGSAYYMAFDMDRATRLDSAQSIFRRILHKKNHYGPAHNALAAVIKQRQLTYLHNYDSLQHVIQTTEIKDPVNFAKVFPDVTYYPGDEVKKMVWSQLYESIVYFPFLSKQNEKFVIPPLHVDLTIAMGSPYFRQATTFDNRQWMDIRGVGSGAAAIEYVVRGSYLERNVVLHEYVHQFHGRVFTDAENRAVRRLYYNAMKEGRTLDYYSANNEHEYLAQTYPAYFEPVKVHPLNHKSINTTADLKAKDSELYTFLDQLVARQRAYLAGNKQAMASNWAEVHLNLAEKAQNSKDYTLATALLDTALVWDAKYQPALIAYAGVKQAQKEYGKAQEWLQKAKAVDANYAPIYLVEAELVEAQRRDGKLKQQEAIAEQIGLYTKALELEDDLLMRAQANQRFREFYLSYGMVPEAIAMAERYVKDGPTVSTYLRDRRDEALAFATWLKGTSVKGTEPEQALAKLVASKPQQYELRRQYADVLAAQGKYKDAFATLEEAQRILSAAGTPRADYMLRMANYKLQQQDKTGAAAAAQPLLDGKANIRGEAYQLAGLYADLGLTGKAEELLKKLPEAVTQQELALRLFAEARILEAKGKSRKAIKAYKEALKTQPYQLEVRNSLVNLLQQNGKTKEAAALQNFGKERITL
ncbi:tetratricopeptide (TPR) repeat protein [Pontibacter aydingkolensis]|uniref:Tetratricopeptide repeat protein n=1 Tax=Pontibacter aydingkolensis TaxID=1911536 RepID=A0ABS7CYT9_9BACT|nr:tetratricopeptide repeat protein [Pontibacter aydingkolensis]MBW7468980.1 tetratricopeptide repeat protein [Pontibacter aydingkolensis]